jgi:hypothetical protein
MRHRTSPKAARWHWLAVWLAIGAGLYAQSGGQPGEASQAPSSSSKKDPVLKLRPPPRPGLFKDPPGRIRLDVAVMDADGKPVAGLGQDDFQLLDNDHPQKILSFQAADANGTDASARVSILLVIDTVNSEAADVAAQCADAEQFLRQNAGHLAQPVTVLWLSDTAYHVLGRDSTDGNALAQSVHDFKPGPRAIHAAMGGAAQRYTLSFRAMSVIADKEVEEPGRKMLIWMGPGWPILPDTGALDDSRVQRHNFDALAMLSNHLRQARMVVCSAGGWADTPGRELLKPVKSELDLIPGRMSIQVIAEHSGGGTMGKAKKASQWIC